MNYYSERKARPSGNLTKGNFSRVIYSKMALFINMIILHICERFWSEDTMSDCVRNEIKRCIIYTCQSLEKIKVRRLT